MQGSPRERSGELAGNSQRHESERGPLGFGKTEEIGTVRIAAQKLEAEARKTVGDDIPGKGGSGSAAVEHNARSEGDDSKHEE